ncbi:MAG TPA: ABC transporter ATP-binding protein [Mogibacterium sp.]|nr:ABC transporter ATP-binding protein [Mogibacterium sp.]
MALVETKNITKSFGSNFALKDINLSIESGQIVGLLGPNGSGKTTLIKLMMGLLQPDMGSIRIEGNEPGVETKKISAYLPDRIVLPSYMTTEQLIRMNADFFDDFNESKAVEMAKSLNLDFGQTMQKMSKGTKEKLQLILTMSREAKLYLLDEPIGGVDPATRDYILRTIITNYSEDAAVIISTHLIQDVESIIDDVIFINRGETVLHKSAEEIREENNKSVDELFREVFKC